MMMLRRELLTLSCALLFAPPAAAQTPTLEVGQVWTLKAPLAPAARVRVGHIIGDVVHVSLWGQPAPEGVQEPFIVIHAAFQREGLAASIDTVVEDQPPPLVQHNFESGLAAWQQRPGNQPESGTIADFYQLVAQVAAFANSQHEP